jgi:hypothetical protein
MHGGGSLVVVEMGERHHRGVHGHLVCSYWGFGRRTTMGYIERKYVTEMCFNTLGFPQVPQMMLHQTFVDHSLE